jgi:hypothetical protein
MCGRFYRQNRASGGTVRHVVTDGIEEASLGPNNLAEGLQDELI